MEISTEEINGTIKRINVVKIVYFSGTGSTARVADCFEKAFRDRGIEVLKSELRAGQKPSNEKEDLLIVLYAVHACNAPEPIYEWINSISNVVKTPAVVISVSGGGEVTPNTACRVGCIKRLQKKGYDVVYEKMIVMPSNWIVPTIEALAVKLLEVLPLKVESIVNDLLCGVIHRTKPNLLNRVLSQMGELEKIGARLFGKQIRVSKVCNACGWCERSCPRGNIKLENGIPAFGKGCVLCLKCIYGCPNRALKSGALSFVVIKDGYNLKTLEKRIPSTETINVEELAKGYLWKGIREYLLDSDVPKK
ncbi:MAG: EFR1 family ferrodoxin [Clostridia bacterium]|nr:EFR1 family ferrodoxin [Clostridia bacterium]